MSKLVIPAPSMITGAGISSLNRFANGHAPSAVAVRELADQINMLMGRRGRVIYSVPVCSPYSTASATDATTFRFAWHSGPLAASIRIVYTAIPAGTARAASDSYAYWVLRTGLTGAGSTTTSSYAFASSVYTGNLKADYIHGGTLTFQVSPDSDYRIETHQVNVFALRSMTVFEEPRSVVDTDTDTNAIDTTKIAQHYPITAATVAQLRTASRLLWARGGHPLFYWSSSDDDGYTQTGTTLTNIHDATTSATSGTFGHPLQIPYSGALHSGNVGVVAWAYARVNNALATGTIEFRDQAGTVKATITVTGTAADTTAWYSTTGNLSDSSGATPTTRIEVYASVTATYNIIIYAYGMFQYV